MRPGRVRHRLAGIDRDLIGERSQRGEHPRAPHQDAARGLLHLVQLGLVQASRGIALALVAGGVDQRMCQTQILPRHQLLVGNQVGSAFLIAVDRPFVTTAGKAGEGHVHVVGSPPHQPDGEFRDLLQCGMAADEVLARTRDHVADCDRLAGFRIRHQAGIGRLMLKIEYPGNRRGGAAQGGMVHRIRYLVGTDP